MMTMMTTRKYENEDLREDDSHCLSTSNDQWHLSLTFNSIPRLRRVKMPKCCAHDATQNATRHDTTQLRAATWLSRGSRPNQNKGKEKYSARARRHREIYIYVYLYIQRMRDSAPNPDVDVYVRRRSRVFRHHFPVHHQPPPPPPPPSSPPSFFFLLVSGSCRCCQRKACPQLSLATRCRTRDLRDAEPSKTITKCQGCHCATRMRCARASIPLSHTTSLCFSPPSLFRFP